MTAGRTVNAVSHHWGTPLEYVVAVRQVFGGRISLDPCSNKYSVVDAAIEYHLPKTDGLSASWDYPTIFVNPPYGADRTRGTTIYDWLRRCAESHQTHNSEVIALVPVATNTSHWKRFIWNNTAAVAFLYDTRLKFLVNGRTGGKGAPMSCAMVYWGPEVAKFLEVFSKYGAAIDLRSARMAKYERAKKQEQPLLFDHSSVWRPTQQQT
ncbi:MAG: DNA N-6-adenine-methyltransferase [Candidatus Hydrogenedentota bacterium]